MTGSTSKRIVLALAGALAVTLGGWWFREDLGRLLGPEPAPVVVSPEAAALAEAKLERLRTDAEPARLSAIEASSLLRYRTPAAALERVHEPTVEFAADTVRLSGTFALSDLPAHPELDRVRLLLPDSSRVEVRGRVGLLPSGRYALDVDRVSLAGIPIPERYYPDLLARFGRRDEPGLAPDAFALSLPAGVGAARIEDGYLILTP